MPRQPRGGHSAGRSVVQIEFPQRQQYQRPEWVEFGMRGLQRLESALQIRGVDGLSQIGCLDQASRVLAWSLTAIDFDAGVWLKSPLWSSGISGLVSG